MRLYRKTLGAALLFTLVAALLMGCAPAAPAPKAGDVAKQILEGQAFTEPYEIAEGKALELLGLSEKDVADAAMFMDVSRVTPECVVVLTAANSSSAKTVEQALKDYRQALKTQYESYRPDEVFKVDQAVLDSQGLQYALVISPSAADAQNILRVAWKR